MKILEAWARGVPVVATPEAAAGVDTPDGQGLLRAEDGPGFAAGIEHLASEADVFRRAAAAGHRALTEHDPRAVAGRLVQLYRRESAVLRHAR